MSEHQGNECRSARPVTSSSSSPHATLPNPQSRNSYPTAQQQLWPTNPPSAKGTAAEQLTHPPPSHSAAPAPHTAAASKHGRPSGSHGCAQNSARWTGQHEAEHSFSKDDVQALVAQFDERLEVVQRKQHGISKTLHDHGSRIAAMEKVGQQYSRR